jgi:hypothetical protein
MILVPRVFRLTRDMIPIPRPSMLITRVVARSVKDCSRIFLFIPIHSLSNHCSNPTTKLYWLRTYSFIQIIYNTQFFAKANMQRLTVTAESGGCWAHVYLELTEDLCPPTVLLHKEKWAARFSRSCSLSGRDCP